MLIGSYSLALQGLRFKNRDPKDLDIIVPSEVELAAFENSFREFRIDEDSPSTQGRQLKFKIANVDIEVFWENPGLTYSKYLSSPHYIELEGRRIPIISPENELKSKRSLVKFRGPFNEDAEKIKWLESSLIRSTNQ